MTYIIVDFEATCDDAGQVPRGEMEIIEIGAVALEGNGPHIIEEFQSFVRPLRHPLLTDFCRGLTHIKQKHVDAAPDFVTLLPEFAWWIASFEDPIFCSWGDYDKHQLHQDCDFHGVPYPFDSQHINIKRRFASSLNMRKPCGLGKALRKVGLEFVGSPHRGIDDARNMANLSPYLFF